MQRDGSGNAFQRGYQEDRSQVLGSGRCGRRLKQRHTIIHNRKTTNPKLAQNFLLLLSTKIPLLKSAQNGLLISLPPNAKICYTFLAPFERMGQT